MFMLAKLPVRLIACLVFGLAVVSTAVAEDYRIWTDSTGKHKVRAKFDSVEDGKAVLICDGGRKVKIALDKLSKADQDFIAERTADSPFENAEGNTEERANKDDNSFDDSPRSVKPDWSALPGNCPPAALCAEWNVTPPSPSAPGYRPRSVSLPPKRDFFEAISGLAVSRVAKAAVVGYVLKRPGAQGDTSVRVVLCDLQRGRTTAAGATSGETRRPSLCTTTGGASMCRNDFGFRQPGSPRNLDRQRQGRRPLAQVDPLRRDTRGGTRRSLG